MKNLSDDLDLLYELNNLRDRAKSLRARGLSALKGISGIKGVEEAGGEKGAAEKEGGEIEPANRDDKAAYKKWITSGDEIEAALLVMVQNHRDMAEGDEREDAAGEVTKLEERLRRVSLDSMFPGATPAADFDKTAPVLTAARVMQALVRRSETVFFKTTMICYYRIVRELYVAAGPDWIIGAARASVDGSASAFITGECIRAVLAFENAINRTVEFFRHTRELLDKHTQIQKMLGCFAAGLRDGDDGPHPLRKWADKAIKRMWLDWYISTDSHGGEMAVYFEPSYERIIEKTPLDEINMDFVGKYLYDLPGRLRESIRSARGQMEAAAAEITKVRDEQDPEEGEKDEKGERKFKEGRTREEKRYHQHTESAHHLAFRAVQRGVKETTDAEIEMSKIEEGVKAGGEICDTGEGVDERAKILGQTLDAFVIRFEDISRSIHRILEPAMGDEDRKNRLRQ